MASKPGCCISGYWCRVVPITGDHSCCRHLSTRTGWDWQRQTCGKKEKRKKKRTPLNTPAFRSPLPEVACNCGSQPAGARWYKQDTCEVPGGAGRVLAALQETGLQRAVMQSIHELPGHCAIVFFFLAAEPQNSMQHSPRSNHAALPHSLAVSSCFRANGRQSLKLRDFLLHHYSAHVDTL